MAHYRRIKKLRRSFRKMPFFNWLAEKTAVELYAACRAAANAEFHRVIDADYQYLNHREQYRLAVASYRDEMGAYPSPVF